MKISKDIVKASVHYVSNYVSSYLHPNFTYHNIVHAAYVAKAVNTLCTVMDVKEHQKNVLLLSAWFHDLGFTKNIEGHEEAGAELAQNFLRAKSIDEDDITAVRRCILSTRYPQGPTMLLEEIICDADLMYLGHKSYLITSAQLRKEWELTRYMTYNDAEWYKLNIHFVTAHHFHTPYCRSYMEERKKRNVELLERMLVSVN
jgi:predicted metal-dependent HD superfamily phosphohydrolase